MITVFIGHINLNAIILKICKFKEACFKLGFFIYFGKRYLLEWFCKITIT